MGRLVVGIGIGVASFAAPLYISEIAPSEVRGALVSLNQLMITIGIVVSYLIDDLFAGFDQGWRYMFLMGAIPALILGFGMFFLPASPRWLVAKGEEKKARQVLARLNPAELVDKELAAIKQTALNQPKGTWSELAEPWVRPALLVGVGIMFVQQATGINTVIYYAPTIFKMAGFSSDTAAITATLGVGLVNVLFTVVSIRLIDRVGRKPLLSWGLICMIISLLALGGAFWLAKILGPSLRWVAVGSLFIYIAGFAVSLGPVAWLLIAEIYPLKIRGLAMSLATLSNWVFNLVIAMSFLTITEALGKAQTFWLYALVGLGGWFFCRHLVPETKGSSLEVIEANLRAGRRTRDMGEPLP
jgi:sugar porter (SP) family MFS transporter